MPRIFVAVPVEESVRAAIAGLRAVPAPQLRWVAEHQYHITLRFLGEIREADVDAVETAVRKAISETFPAAGGDGPSPAGLELVARGVGAFPSPNLARVVWVGVEGDVAALKRLQEAVARRLHGLGEPEDRPFSPHITVARARQPSPLPDALRRFEGHEFGRWNADAAEIIESVLTPAGPIYTVRGRVPLGAGADDPAGLVF